MFILDGDRLSICRNETFVFISIKTQQIKLQIKYQHFNIDMANKNHNN